MSKPRKMRFAQIGCGDIASAYVAAAHEVKGVELVALCDVRREHAEGLVSKAPGPVRVYDNIDEVLAAPDLDAVVISVPHYLHPEVTIKAAKAGKHVMCDKPIATSIKAARQMAQVCRECGVLFSINYAMNCGPVVTRAREWVQQGVFGDIYYVESITRGDKPAEYWTGGWSRRVQTDWRSSKAKAGGGVLLMNSSHYLAALLHVTGKRPVFISGLSGTFNTPVEVEDTAAGVFQLEGGVIGAVIAGSIMPGGSETEAPIARIVGTRGQVLLYNHKLKFFLRRKAKGFAAGEWHEVALPLDNMYVPYLEAFAAAFRGKQPVPVPPELATDTLQIVLGVFASSAKRRIIPVV